jgi:hypothetical protein
MSEKMSLPSLQKERIQDAIDQVAMKGKDFHKGVPAARESLIASARELLAVAESPLKTLLWNIWALVCLQLPSKSRSC